MTKILTCGFIVLWLVIGGVEASKGDLFRTTTSFSIAAWNVFFLRDMIRIEKKVGK